MKVRKKGQLKIFFGYAGTGEKSLAMLQAAVRAKEAGKTVLIGHLLSCDSDAMRTLRSRLESIPLIQRNNQTAFDLDAAFHASPDILLLDDLACTNPSFCFHRRRYQDVEELLNHGIDVYTTVQVSDIESLHDTVTSITGTASFEHIPDAVFDGADQVELIDEEPLEVLEYLQKTHEPVTLEQLTALRELALRRCADRIKHLSNILHERQVYRTDEHILTCLSASVSNARIIRTAARMAEAFHCRFTALFIETPEFSASGEDARQRLREHMKLAETLGATVETIYGEDIPYQIAEFARLSGVTKVVLGRSAVARKHFWDKQPLTDQLLGYIPEIDIHIIPDNHIHGKYSPTTSFSFDSREIFSNILKSAGILTGASLLSLLFYHLGFTDSNIIMVYILGVLLTSVVTPHRVYSLVSSVSSVLIFNYLFTRPRFSLSAYGTGYPVTFAVMFLTAYITGTFALRYKKQAGQAAKTAYRTQVLYDTDQLLSKAKDKQAIFETTGKQLLKLLHREIVIYENDNGESSKPYYFRCSEKEGIPDLLPEDTSKVIPSSDEKHMIVQWVLTNNRPAGADTDTMAFAADHYLPIRVNDHNYGVVSIAVKDAPLETSERGILLSLLGEAALALENEKNAREKEAAAILAEREQLRANLLRTISHDLRTPLTTIMGNASSLLQNGEKLDADTIHQTYEYIYEDSLWLIKLVENLLYATRIEDGRMIISAIPELVTDIIGEAMRHLSRQASRHHLCVDCPDEFLMVKADARLLTQVLINLIDNAIKYTPEGSTITVKATREEKMVLLSVSDTGSGIPDNEKDKIFDKFYSGSNHMADDRRGLGLGLFLCQAIVNAHDGTIEVTDNTPHGTVFRFRLPAEEVPAHE